MHVDFGNCEVFEVRSFSLGPVHFHCDVTKGCLTEWQFRKGSLCKSPYFRNSEVAEISRKSPQAEHQLLNVPVVPAKRGVAKTRAKMLTFQEHAPATYRKALIEIIAQYLGVVVLPD